MSFFQNLAGQLFGGQSRDQAQSLLESVTGLLNHPQVGGISGLAQLFQKQGLGQIVAGWISTGPNPPVSATQLQQVLGSQRIAEIAQKLGIDTNQAAARLAETLPAAVDQLTPNGTVPAEGSMNAQAMLGSLVKKFLGG